MIELIDIRIALIAVIIGIFSAVIVNIIVFLTIIKGQYQKKQKNLLENAMELVNRLDNIEYGGQKMEIVNRLDNIEHGGQKMEKDILKAAKWIVSKNAEQIEDLKQYIDDKLEEIAEIAESEETLEPEEEESPEEEMDLEDDTEDEKLEDAKDYTGERKSSFDDLTEDIPPPPPSKFFKKKKNKKKEEKE